MKAPTPKAGNFNTLTLTGLSVLWAVILGFIHPGWIALSVPLLLGGYGSELRSQL
jgi:hypothetical protein